MLAIVLCLGGAYLTLMEDWVSEKWQRLSSFTEIFADSNLSTAPQVPTLSRMNETFTFQGFPIVETSRYSFGPPVAPGTLSGMNPVFGPEPITIQPNSIAYEPPIPVPNQPSLSAWKFPLCLVEPNGPIDSILIGLNESQGSLAPSGTRGTLVIGPFSPSFKALLNPEYSNSVHPVTSVTSNIPHMLPFRGLPMRAAALFVSYHFSQWQIFPSEATYNNLPEWHVPRASQLITPRPIWVDQVNIHRTTSVTW